MMPELLMDEFEWTTEKVAALLRLYDDGASYSNIMAAIGCRSRSSVCGKILRLRQQGIISTVRRLPTGSRALIPRQGRKIPGVAPVPGVTSSQARR